MWRICTKRSTKTNYACFSAFFFDIKTDFCVFIQECIAFFAFLSISCKVSEQICCFISLLHTCLEFIALLFWSYPPQLLVISHDSFCSSRVARLHFEQKVFQLFIFRVFPHFQTFFFSFSARANSFVVELFSDWSPCKWIPPPYQIIPLSVPNIVNLKPSWVLSGQVCAERRRLETF